MNYQNNIKILIDKRKLETLLRLGCDENIIWNYIKTGNLTLTGDSLIDDNLESMMDIKDFKNWGGSRKGSGRKPRKTLINNQDENQLENQDDCNLEDKDIDKDIYNNNNTKEKKAKRKESFIPPTYEEVVEYFKSRCLTESAAKRFYDYYTAGCWKDRDGVKVKNWKQKAIAVWDKPENKEKTPEDIKLLEKREEESIIQNYWLKNCSLLNTIKKDKLILTNVVNILINLKDKNEFAKKVVQTMTKQLLTEEQLQKIKTFIESRI